MPSKPLKIHRERLLGRLDVLDALSEWACKTDRRQCPRLFAQIDTMRAEARAKIERYDENAVR